MVQNSYSRFCVRAARDSGSAVLFCPDLEVARGYARLYTRIFGHPFEVYLTSVYYG